VVGGKLLHAKVLEQLAVDWEFLKRCCTLYLAISSTFSL
jgi:hypothetical protein